MMTKESFRIALVLMLSMSADTDISDHPSGDLAIKLVDGETFRIEVKDWDGEFTP